MKFLNIKFLFLFVAFMAAFAAADSEPEAAEAATTEAAGEETTAQPKKDSKGTLGSSKNAAKKSWKMENLNILSQI